MGNCIFCQTSGGSQCCAIWSGSLFYMHFRAGIKTNRPYQVSIVFLVFVGIVMSSPPVFVKDMTDEKAEIAASNAYKVAALEGVTFLLALYMYYYRKRQENARERAAARGGGGALHEPLVAEMQVTSSPVGATSSSDTTRNRRKANTTTII